MALLERTDSKIGIILHSKHHHRKVLLSSFHLNGHISAFLFPDKTSNHLAQYSKQKHRKVLFSSFHLNGHTLGF